MSGGHTARPRSSLLGAPVGRRARGAWSLALLTVASLEALAVEAGAQTQDPGPGGPSVRETFERFVRRAAYLVPDVLDRIEQPIFAYAVWLAWVAAGMFAVFAFLRQMRQTEGATSDTLWWFARFAVVMSLLLGTNDLLSFLAGVGHHIAFGPDNTSFLAELVSEQQHSFDASYRKFAAGYFVVEVDGVQTPVPGSSASRSWLGVLSSKERTFEDVTRALDPEGWSMTDLFTFFSFGRTLMEFADLFLILLSYVLMFAMRLAAPFMVAVAVDRQTASRISYNFLWGAIVLTLVLPIVSQVTRILVYAWGNVAMALGDGAPAFVWDAKTLSVIAKPGVDPVYTIALASLLMTIGGLAMFGSPYISFKLCVGQVFESVSQTVAGWFAAIASTGVELYTTAGAAALSRQAEVTQAQGAADGGRAEATANRDAGLERNQATATLARAQNHATAVSGATAAMAGARAQAAVAITSAHGQNKTLEFLAAKEQGEVGAQTSHSVVARRIDNAQTSQNAALAIDNQIGEMRGRYAGALPVAGSVGAGPVGAGASVSSVAGTKVHGETVIRNAARGAEVANLGATQHVINDQQAGASRIDLSKASVRAISAVNLDVAGSNAGAALEAGREIAGGYYAAERIANAGVDASKTLGDKAEQTVYGGRVAAIDTNLGAARQAAELRAQAAVLSQVGHSVARRVDEMGDQLRY